MNRNNYHFRWVIVCHDWTPGPPHALRDYLLQNGVGELLFIGHRNRYITNNPVDGSYFQLYRKGRIVLQTKLPRSEYPEFIGYIRDYLLTLYWVTKYLPRADVFVGSGNLNAFAGLLLRLTAKTRSVIYYVIDYIPKRFGIWYLDRLYVWLDYFCAKNAESTWNLSRLIIDERQRQTGKVCAGQMVVPVGCRPIKMVKNRSKELKAGHSIVYLGSLYKKQGIEQVIRALPEVIRTVPDIRLSVIGDGPEITGLKRLAGKLGITRKVEFYGYLSDSEADRILSDSDLGMAMYDPEVAFSVSTEPGKVKRYLAAGLPVLITRNIPFSEELLRRNCGIPAVFDIRSISSAINQYFSESNRDRSKMNRHALEFAGEFSWDKVFGRAFAETEKNVYCPVTPYDQTN